MYKERKTYFAWLFSIFILFAMLIILKKPVYMIENDTNIWFLLPLTLTPASLIFMKNKPLYQKIVVAYLPAFAGFVLSLILNNSVYFLASFPIFLINFLIIFPRGKR